MTHIFILQTLLDTCANKRYLELGVASGQTFTKIRAKYKVGIDPKSPSDAINNILDDNCKYYQMASDDFFILNKLKEKFDVIFVDGLHEYEQSYKDICNSLDVLAENGVIVVYNCKPTSEIIGLPPDEYRLVPPKIKKEHRNRWTGDVWKAIVRLRSVRSDLFVFTLNFGFGCAIVVKENAETLLKFTCSEIKMLSYAELSNNAHSFLNLKPPKYFDFFVNHHRNIGEFIPESFQLYVEAEDALVWLESCNRKYYIDEPTTVQNIHDAFILPYLHNGSCSGGVYDASGNFVAGHVRDIEHLDSTVNIQAQPLTPIQDILYINETVIYGGLIINHYGHFITECLSRMWWFLENPGKHKIVFISPDKNIKFIDFFLMLGICKEDIILLKEPTRFNSVIVPDQTTHLRNGYKDKAIMVFDAIRDSVTPAPYEKVYFSRTGGSKDIVNEKYFENYFRSLNYKIIFPESLSIKEQVSILAGVKELACASGTLHHQILFSHDGVNVTVLNKTRLPLAPHFWITLARNARCTFIDVSMNFLPHYHFASCFLFAPTVCWRRFIHDKTGITINDDDALLSDAVLEYLELWAKTVVNISVEWLKEYSKFTIADIVIGVHKYILGNDLDEPTKATLKQRLTIGIK